MPRVLRSTLADGYFHVFARGVDGVALFRDTGDRRRFVRLLRTCEKRHKWTCHAYCLMTTHYHLVVEATRRDLSRGIQRLHGQYAAGFNKRHGRFGHLFAGRYSARMIESEEYLFEACAYVVLNPVRAGLCNEPHGWPWSYCRFGHDAI